MSLERRTTALNSEQYDLLIAGAGIFGACAAWEAALRGYRVAIIDKGDFCSGVSENSYKFVHGGIRYIQHLDIPRVRASCRERSALLRIAPHLVHPQPIAIPTYGLGMSGRPVLAAGMYLYDLLTLDRNRGIPHEDRRIPWSRFLSKSELLDRFPGVDAEGLTGAALFSDAQMHNPPRLVLAFIQSAAAKGAEVCNYLKLKGFRTENGSIAAASVEDQLTGENFEIRAKTYLNTTGPWTDALLENRVPQSSHMTGTYSRDACFLVPRIFEHDTALAVMGRNRDPDAVMSRPARHLFIVPWGDYSLIGTWHRVVGPTPDKIGLEKREIEEFMSELLDSYPELGLSIDDVTMCNWGLVPFGENQDGTENLSYGKRSILIDHERDGGPPNMVSLVGIRYTMGRGDAQWAMKLIARKLKDSSKAPRTDHMPVYGGDVSDISALEKEVAAALPTKIPHKTAYSLARNYGSNAIKLIKEANPESLKVLPNSDVLEAQILDAAQNEMAQRLSDIVFRRTDLGSGGAPDPDALKHCATLVKPLLKLSDAEVQRQLEEVDARIPGWQ